MIRSLLRLSRLRGAVVWPAALWLAGASCGSRQVEWTPVVVPPPADIEWTLFLIGDAGAPHEDDPVLRVLAEAAAAVRDRSTIVFLGDNIYPAGLPAVGAVGREVAESLLQRQIDVFEKSGSRGFFIPGNHDWAEHGPDGLRAIIRQGEFVRAQGGERVEFLPTDGCPGPAVRDVGPFRLVMVDTHWWLHTFERPFGPESPCAAHTPEEVVQGIGFALLEASPRRALLLAHHPITTGGIHGGRYPIGDHFFPLRNLRRWLWLPIPVIGTLYPLVRGAGVSPQDIANPLNRTMREAMQEAMTAAAPLAFVAGHEHNLQVMEGDIASWHLVSGSGYYGHVSHTTWLPSTRFAAETSGFMRLDALSSGQFRLGVIGVEFDGRVREIFSILLE